LGRRGTADHPRQHPRVRRPRWAWVLGAAGLLAAAGVAVALRGSGLTTGPAARAEAVLYQPPT
jgi:hypothetical protein